MEGKVNAQYIDFIDETKFFRLASLARKKILIKEGHEVEIFKAGDCIDNTDIEINQN